MLLFKIKDKIVLIVVRGDVWLDNKKLKEIFGVKVCMLSSDEVVIWIGYLVGGVCLFGLENLLVVYCDVFFRYYQEVLFVVGVIYSVVCIELECMVQFIDVIWVDVCLQLYYVICLMVFVVLLSGKCNRIFVVFNKLMFE